MSHESKFEIWLKSICTDEVEREAQQRVSTSTAICKIGWRLSASGSGDLVKVDRIMNTEKYLQIFTHQAIRHVKRLIGSIFIFHDNDPKQ